MPQFTFRDQDNGADHENELTMFKLSHTQPCKVDAIESMRECFERKLLDVAYTVNDKQRPISLTVREKRSSEDVPVSMIKSAEIPAFDDLEFDLEAQAQSFNKSAAILVVDDNHFNLVAAKLLLGEFGLHCDTAISGQKGLKLIKQRLEL